MEQGLIADIKASCLIEAVADTVTIGHAGTRSCRRSKVLLVDGMQKHSSSEDGEENAGMDVSEERKLECADHISNM